MHIQMEHRFRKIKFGGEDYLLLGAQEGPICTADQFTKGHASFAYLSSDGKIRRYCKVIGSIKDIEFGVLIDEQKAPKSTIEALNNILQGAVDGSNGWRKPGE